MDEISLNKRDRGNIYREDATNVTAYVLTVYEVRHEIDMDEIFSKFDEAQGAVFSKETDVTYLVFKIINS